MSPLGDIYIGWLLVQLYELIAQQYCSLQGGTAAAPDHLNDRNQGHPATYQESTTDCQYLVVLLQDPAGNVHNMCLQDV